MPLPREFISELKKDFKGEIRDDLVSRLLYSTDASIYQIEPLGVAFPEDADDIAAAAAACARHHVPLLARGSGSSLGGQAIGQALILDCSRSLTRILELDPEEGSVVVEPGVILSRLDRYLAPYGLQFGPDPASMERASVGGSLANNATGAHSMLYGMFGDNLLSAEVVMVDGSVGTWGEVEQREAKGDQGTSDHSSLLERITDTAHRIRNEHADLIRSRWPRTWRNASGYALNSLFPWSPAEPPGWERAYGTQTPYPPAAQGHLNLAQLLAGSEGTLGIVTRAKLKLVPRTKQTVLGVLGFSTFADACRVVPEILELGPSAVELVSQSLVELARSIPLYASQIAFLEQVCRGGSGNLLVVEFAGEDKDALLQQARALGGGAMIASDPAVQKQVWGVRKIGLGLVMSRPGDTKPAAFIEDIAVPVERLSEFVLEMERVTAGIGVQAEIYGHASAGCLHIRPILNLKTGGGVSNMRAIAEAAAGIASRLGGTLSGEHGDGIARAEWLERVYGREIVSLFKQLKQAADPDGILNPGKIVDAPPMDSNLRYGEAYRSAAWTPVMRFPTGEARGLHGTMDADGDNAAGLGAAVEHCNGAGVCRKREGVMCPSFQATGEEMHSTRGRANLLRAMISGKFPSGESAEAAVREALDLCLACKGCKSECPSAVDMAKLKYEFMQHYYREHPHRLRDYLFGYIDRAGRLGSPFWWIGNLILGSRLFSEIGSRYLGLARERSLPKLASKPLSRRVRPFLKNGQKPGGEKVFFLNDAFSEYFQPEAGEAAIRVLEACGCEAILLPVIGSGRTLISKGFLEAAQGHAARLVECLKRLDPEGKLPVVGVEPSEIFTLSDEYPDLLPNDAYAGGLARRAWMIDEFLLRPGLTGQPRLERLKPVGQGKQVLLHGHCYQKSRPPSPDGYPTGAAASIAMLKAAGYSVELIDSGCCGMAGAFGYESEHYRVSMQVGELSLLPAIRAAGDEVIAAAAGVSCQAQITDGAQRPACHPITLVFGGD